MSHFDVGVQVLEEYDGLVSGQWLTKVAQDVLAAESPRPGAKLSIVMAGDEVVRSLNKQHRGLDENTDVLSFSFSHQGEYYGERAPVPVVSDEVAFVLPTGEDDALGEVIISYPQAQRQAAEAGHPVEKELAVLLTHGILHLLGHDHAEPGEETAMKRVEAAVLAQVWPEA